MTDNEIIKAQADKIFLLERALKDKTAEIEKLTSLCTSKDVIINSQEAEIEGLKQISPIVFGEEHKFCNLLGNTLVFSKTLKDYNDMRKGLKAEAIKEFAERLKERTATFYSAVGIREEADHLIKEMTEGGVDNA